MFLKWWPRRCVQEKNTSSSDIRKSSRKVAQVICVSSLLQSVVMRCTCCLLDRIAKKEGGCAPLAHTHAAVRVRATPRELAGPRGGGQRGRAAAIRGAWRPPRPALPRRPVPRVSRAGVKSMFTRVDPQESTFLPEHFRFAETSSESRDIEAPFPPWLPLKK